MRILFFSDNFPPESNAPASRTFEHCREWVSQGADVTVITCQPNFPTGEIFKGYRNRLYQKEYVDGIRVIRVWTYITPNRGTIRRSIDYLSYCLSAFIASFFVRTDVIVATSPQLFAALSGYLASLIKGKPWIMEVRDLWPESIRAVNASNNRRILRNLAKLVQFLYRKASAIVVVTESFKERLVEEGVPAQKVSIVKNGVLPERFFPSRPDPLLLAKHDLTNKFVVGYIGTHGLAHGLQLILKAAEMTTDSGVHFLMIGDGAMKKRLQIDFEQRNLQNVTMLPAVGRDEVNTYINLIDAAVVPLIHKKTFKTVLPSKIFENASCGKPILLGVEGEAAQLIQRFGAGVCFEPENESDFLRSIARVKSDPSFYIECLEGCRRLARSFERTKLARQMLAIIKIIVFPKSSKLSVRQPRVDFTK